MTSARARKDEGTERLGFAARLSLFYAAVFLLVGCNLPYFPVWLDWRGLTPDEIGMILAAPLVVRLLFTPSISFLADRSGNRRLALILLAWGAFASYLFLTAAEGFWAILAVTMTGSLFWTSIMPLTEAVAMEGVRRFGADYGRMRIWGSLSFIAMSFAGGLALERWGPAAALWLLIGSIGCTALAAHILPRPTCRGRLEAATALPRIRLRDAWELARSPLFILFLVATGTAQSTHAVYYAFGTIHWASQGISPTVIGMLWSVGVIAEILFFLYGRQVIARADPVMLLMAAATASIVRWSATALSPPLWLLFPVQALHGVTFGAAHLAAVHFITDEVPENATGTGQGLYATSTAGIFMGVAIASAGPLYSAFGASAYQVMAAVALVSAVATLALKRVRDAGVVIRFSPE